MIKLTTLSYSHYYEAEYKGKKYMIHESMNQEEGYDISITDEDDGLIEDTIFDEIKELFLDQKNKP